MKPQRRTFLFLHAAALLVATSAAADPSSRQAFSAEGVLCLTSAAARARVDYPDGRAVEFALPTRTELSSLAALADGWIAAGYRLDGEGMRRLVLFEGGRDGAERLAEPANPRSEARIEPIPLIARGELVGMAWMEGPDDRSLAVYAAPRLGERWGKPERVAPQGPGSQLALTGAVLTDGSWLLAWAAYDGHDDEILWSIRRQGSWSAPQRVAAENGEPDITPTLAASGNGALLAWSRRVGFEYRVELSRFDGSAWSAESVLGEPGSVFPSFLGGPSGETLLYRSARPRGWVVLELDRAGSVTQRAAVNAESTLRPLVLPAGDGHLKLVWPGSEAEVRLEPREVEPR